MLCLCVHLCGSVCRCVFLYACACNLRGSMRVCAVLSSCESVCCVCVTVCDMCVCVHHVGSVYPYMSLCL